MIVEDLLEWGNSQPHQATVNSSHTAKLKL